MSAAIKALKTTFLLGGNPDPNTWDDDTREIAEACIDAVERHDLVFHFHTSAGGTSDINNFIPLVEKYGKRIKIYLVHFGGGVSGHIKLVPQFLDWVEEGYKVYCDTTWTIGFGARWLLTEIEKRGVGEDRVLFASDEPWSDFWSEYYKIYGAPVGDELKASESSTRTTRSCTARSSRHPRSALIMRGSVTNAHAPLAQAGRARAVAGVWSGGHLERGLGGCGAACW